MVSVTITVETAPGGRAEMAPVSDAAGQLVTVGAQEMMVRTVVASTVSVVCETDVLPKGAGGPLATGRLLLRPPVGAAAPPAAGKPEVGGGRGGRPVAEPLEGGLGVAGGAVPLAGGGGIWAPPVTLPPGTLTEGRGGRPEGPDGGGRPDADGPPVPVTGELEVSAVPDEDDEDAAGACAPPPPVTLRVGRGGSPVAEPDGIGARPEEEEEEDSPASVTGELELRAEPGADKEGMGAGWDAPPPVAFAVGTGGRPEPDDAVTYTVLTETGETSLVVRPGQSVTSDAQDVTV